MVAPQSSHSGCLGLFIFAGILCMFTFCAILAIFLYPPSTPKLPTPKLNKLLDLFEVADMKLDRRRVSLGWKIPIGRKVPLQAITRRA